MSELQRKILALIILLLITFAGGVYYGRGQKQIEVREVKVQGETVEKVVEKIVEKVRTVKPDGTVEEREITKDVLKDTTERTVSVDREKKETPILPKWSVGGGVISSYSKLLPPSYYGSVGYRALGPIWIEALAGTEHLGVGIRVEF
jgi:hypothetical protein